jgi:ribonuclease HI
MVYIYTDGASSGNPGPGGYGVVLVHGSRQKELSGGFRLTTNNRMELLAVIVGLEALKKAPLEVTVVSDSKYVVDSVTKGWVYGWEKKNFAGKKNADLWMRYLRIARQHRVQMQWVKGHNNHPLNERCDRLAVAAGKQPNLPADVGFERERSKTKSNMF